MNACLQRLQSNESELDDWEPKRIERPEGVPEWGVPPAASSSPSSKIRLDSGQTKTPEQVENDKSFANQLEQRADEENSQLNASKNSVGLNSKSKKVILGPDGKPCRACNSKLAFSQAMRTGATTGGAESSAKGKAREENDLRTSGSSLLETKSDGILTPELNPSGPTSNDCPPDGEELGRSTWSFLHSTAAYYPESPTQAQKSSLLSLFKSLPDLYPCSHCAENLRGEYRREKSERGGYEKKELTMENAVISGRFARLWLCGIHNEINERLGKEKFNCSDNNLRKRWKDGDDSCE